MNRFVVFCVLLFLCTEGFSQKLNIGKDERVSSATLFKEKGTLSLLTRFRSVRFVNPTFVYAMENEIMSASGGIEFGIARMFYPIEIEVSGFYSFFTVDNSPGLLADQSLQHRGIEFMVNYFVLPYIGGISKWLCPYLGAGYQTSQIAVSSESDISVGTGGWLLKGGVRIYLSKKFFLTGEYKQTVPTDSERLFSMWTAGLGFTY
ncbi:MAG: hypothetical protein LBD91_00140 [Prevotellaceae bacterium]|jgi:hypothetical protein|nr:hypothetical protein [Prevotellaceae bacterium]